MTRKDNHIAATVVWTYITQGWQNSFEDIKNKDGDKRQGTGGQGKGGETM
jgi:hypothetical protein